MQDLKELREAFGTGVAFNMQNLMNSHDATRIGSAVANPDGRKFGDWGRYFNWSQKSNNKTYNARKPTPEQLQKQKLIAAFQILYLGSPMIYYGDEAGMWGANDPDCRKPMLWPEKKYDPETFNPDQTKHDPDAVAFNTDLFNWYKKFIALRKQYTSIRLGSYTTLLTDDAQKLYAFSRKYGNEEVIVIINRGNKAVSVPQELLKTQAYKDVFTKTAVKKLTVQPMDIVVLATQTSTQNVANVSAWPRGITYEIFVLAFADSDGDGKGDIKGMTSKLDYLKDLGVEGIWLMPMNPSPSYHKYDVSDYYSIHPDYGTMDDFRKFIEEAHKRNIKVIMDMVVNHSGSQNAWFKDAIANPNSPYRDYYVWTHKDDPQTQTPGRIIAGDSGNRNRWNKVDSSDYHVLFIFRAQHA